MINYYFVVDTNSYVGNFEREMSTYMTGWSDGYCSDIQQEFISQFPDKQDYFWGVLRILRTEYGDSIAEMDGPGYTSLKFLFDGEPKQEDIDFLKQRAIDFAEECNKRNDSSYKWLRNIKIRGFRLEIKTTTKEYRTI